MKIVKGRLNGTGKKAAIIKARRNEQIVDNLLKGAVEELERHGVEKEDVTVYEVPGAWEISGCAEKIIKNSAYDMLICLGAVIRGDTPHFDYISGQVSRTIAELGIKSEYPVAFGILTCDSLDQAMERAGGKSGNKGEEAAKVALEMSDIYTKVSYLE